MTADRTQDPAVEHGLAPPGAASDRLAVRRLTLTNFRSYPTLRLGLDRRPLVLVGANGAGKTNLLEAVSLLAPGRGLRRARLSELVHHDRPDDGWAVAATVDLPGGRTDIGTGMVKPEPGADRAERRAVRIDGATVRGPSALAEIVAMTWLTPEMDRLLVDAASARRRFLDRIVYGFDPAHAGRVAAYETAMRQRLRLLRGGGGDPAWLAALETTMAEKGVAISVARRQVVDRLDRACAAAETPFPQAGLRLLGAVEEWLAETPALAAEDRLRTALAANRAADGEAGRTSTGPHRSDLGVRYLAKDRPAETVSTGEQKALLIAIVLATARLQAAERGAAPLLLMDEVVAHLDKSRRNALFAELQALGAQAWLTGTDASLFAGLGDAAQFLRVDDGTVIGGEK
ncbi:MAG: DNA replication/repair protein RecF [Alphaproteobacteria bacterium]|nr:DNA replication/repair protein RecF [Alphaproteobacteria bacterium]